MNAPTVPLDPTASSSPLATASPSPPATASPSPPVPPPTALLDRLLRAPTGLAVEIADDGAPLALVRGLVLTTAAGAAIYGVAVGLQGGLVQALLTGIKLPLVLLGGAAVSLPALHVACAMAGVRLGIRRLGALVLQALASASVTMAGLAPFITVWWLSVSVDTASPWAIYRRVVLAAVGVAAIGGLVGASRLARALPLKALAPWTVILGLSTLQLAWLVRPLVGMPDRPLVLLRPLESDALTEILKALAAVLS